MLLGVISTCAVTLQHMKLARLEVEVFMLQGRPVIDSASPPRWFAVVCEVRGAAGVLSRPAADVDPGVLTDIELAQRGSVAARLPSWSELHSSPSPRRGQLLEQAHGLPAPMFYRASQGEEARWSILPIGAALNVLVSSVAWLFVIRLPASLRRAKRWFLPQAQSSMCVPTSTT